MQKVYTVFSYEFVNMACILHVTVFSDPEKATEYCKRKNNYLYNIHVSIIDDETLSQPLYYNGNLNPKAINFKDWTTNLQDEEK
jgi:hypothetical protein